jgi:carbon monoxide dehydrogenase subunit G
MKKIGILDVIEAPVDQVWNIVADFGGLDKWAPIESCTIEGSGVGAIRTVVGRGPFGRELRVRERLESLDPEAHEITYTIVGKSPLPVADYLGRIGLKSDDEGNCIIDWSCTMRPKIPTFLFAPMVKSTYRSGVAGLKSLIAST